MILPKDFQIEVGTTERGTFVRVLHRPTGKCRAVDPVRGGGSVERLRERLIREIESELYNERDVRVDIGCGEAGDFVRITHLPTGKTRMVYPLGKRSAEHVKLEMLDEIVSELVWEKAS